MNEFEYIDSLYHRLAKKRINLIIEYITQILNDKDYVNGNIIFSTNANYVTVEISVPNKNFLKSFDLISLDYSNLLYTYLLDMIFETFKDNETISISPFCNIREVFVGNRCEMRLANLTGSSLQLKFKNLGKYTNIFLEKAKEYNQKIEQAIGRELTLDDILESCLDLDIIYKREYNPKK